MLNSHTSDILTVFGAVLGIISLVIGIYGLEDKKRTKVIELLYKVLFSITMLINVYNVYTFFNTELAHKSIFMLLIAIVSIVILSIFAIMLKIVDIQKDHLKITKNIQQSHNNHLYVSKANALILLEVCTLLNEIDKKEFSNRFEHRIEEISSIYKENFANLDKNEA